MINKDIINNFMGREQLTDEELESVIVEVFRELNLDKVFKGPVLDEAIDQLDLNEDTLAEVSFSSKNFPLAGNESFGGSGERTDYASMADSTYKTNKNTLIFTLKDSGLDPQPLSIGSEITIKQPAKLYRGSDIGLEKNKNRIFTLVRVGNLQGYILISAIEKPSGKSQARVGTGSSAQDSVAAIVNGMALKNNLEFKKISSAPAGSTRPDLVVQYGEQQIQFEIKGRKADSGFITVFDKSARRGKEVEILETVIKAYIAKLEAVVNFNLESGQPLQEPQRVAVKDALTLVGLPHTFEGVIDFYQKYVNKSYGFVGDVGVIKSGKLPSDFVTDDPSLLSEIRSQIITHLRESGDDYFVVWTVSGETADIYSTGAKNPLAATDLPEFARAKLATYGGPSSGSMRVGFKVALVRGDESNIPDTPKEV